MLFHSVNCLFITLILSSGVQILKCFHEVRFICFFFGWLCPWYHIQEIIGKSDRLLCDPCFLLKVLGLVFRFIICFEFLCVCCTKFGSDSILLHENIQFYQHHLVQTVLSPLNVLGTLVTYHLTTQDMVVYTRNSSTQMVKVGWSQVGEQPGLYTRPCFKQTKMTCSYKCGFISVISILFHWSAHLSSCQVCYL
jgi:hypothetical protein